MILSPALIRYHITQLRQSPATGVFLTCGWVAGVLLTFISGQLVATNRAELMALFTYLPWILAILIPTLTMPAASENRRGVTERLATLPHTAAQRLFSRFLVLWGLLGLWILGFWPLVATLYYLGTPDLGPVLTGLLGTWLLAAPLLAASLFICLRAQSGVGGLLGALGVCLLLILLGTTTVTSWFSSFPGLGWLPSTAHITLLGAYQPFMVGLLNLAAIFLLTGTTFMVLGLILADRSVPRNGLPAFALGAAFSLLAVIPTFGWMQLDTTADYLHTPSESTISALRQMPAPVTFTLHLSQNNPDVPPAVHQYAHDLQNLLLHLRAVAPLRVNVKLSNADASIPAAISALQAGATEQPLPTGTTYFAALTADVEGHRATIPALDPARLPVQEYDVMSLVQKATTQTPPHITILATNPDSTNWYKQLQGSFIFTPVNPVQGITEIPNGTNVLVLPDDAALPQTTVTAIRNYLNNGGNVILLADPFSRTLAAQPTASNDTRLSSLLPEWGITYVSDTLIADPTQATLAQQAGAGATPYPYWLQLDTRNLNTSLPFTAGVHTLFLPEAGKLALNAESTFTISPIITSGGNARAVSLTTFENTPAELATAGLPKETGHNTIAAMTSGAFSEQATHSGNLVVVADSDWLTPTSLKQSPGNLTLLTNMLHYLSGQSMLTQLRAKGAEPRTLTRIESMANRLTQQTARTEQKIATRLYEVTQNLNANPENLAQAQEEEFTLRQQLREIRQQTRHHLQTLENALLLINLTLMPTVIGVLFFLQRRRQRLKATSTL